MISKLRYIILLLVFFHILLPVQAQSFFNKLHWSYSGSLAILASDNGTGSDPSQIVPSLGVSAALPVLKFLRAEITEDIYFTNYEYNWAHGYPMACTPENRKTFVLGLTTGFLATGFFPINEKGIAARVYGGLTIDIRLVLQAFGLHPDDQIEAGKQTDAISSYFWGSGRFLFIPVGAGMDFPINSNFLAGFDLRAWIPVYRIWTNEDIPSIDGWRFSIGIRITPRKQS